MFEMDSRLKNSTHLLASLPLCELLLSKNAAWPWYLLVPRVFAAKDIVDLNHDQQALFMAESNALSEWVKFHHKPDSLNVAALGNIVEQLHVHHVARYKQDAAWPNPIWGNSAVEERPASEIEEVKREVITFLSHRGILVGKQSH